MDAFFDQDDDGNVWQVEDYREKYEEGEIVEIVEIVEIRTLDE